MSQQQNRGPQQQPYYEQPQQQQMYYGPPPQQQMYYPPMPLVRPANTTYKTLAIISFVLGFGFHIFGLIPFIGILFALVGFCCDILGFVFLCLI